MGTKIKAILNSRKLQFDILSSFFILQVLTALSITYYTYTNNSKTLVDFSNKLTETISFTAVNNISDRFRDIKVSVELGSFIVHSHKDVTIENTNLVDYMLGYVKQFGYTESIFIGTEEGRFFQIKKMPEGSTYRSSNTKLLPKKTAYAVRILDRDDNEVSEEWNYLDADGKLLETEHIPEFQINFDHKVRPWYIKAMQNREGIWSDIYIFSTTRDPGIACAYPLQNGKGDYIGVIGSDLPLKGISDILRNNTLEGTSMVINQKGEVIAHLNELNTSKVVNGETQMITVEDLKDKAPSIAYKLHLQNPSKNHIVFKDTKDLENIATFKKFEGEQFKGWDFVIVTPIDVFIGAVKKTQRITLLICLGILSLSIFLIVYIAKRIATPINILSNQADLITNFNLEPPEKTIKSGIREIKELQNAINRMRTSLSSFGKFVPKNLVRKLIDKGVEVKVGGKVKKLSIIFTDIAGFTTISETYPPEKLVQHLSEYFEELAEIITQENGTIDKYVGDAIMAFWGAPQNDKDHAIHACKTALLCQKRLLDLNRKWIFEKKPPLITRIGIHCGDVIVGNIGSSERLNYTIVGDPVNTTARLEGANKFYNTSIIISEEVLKHAYDHVIIRPLDILAVKGKNISIKIYELVAMQNSDPLILPSNQQIAFCKAFTKGFEAYLDKRWDDAINNFLYVIENFGPDYASNMYIERCRDFKANPPPSNWDGVFKLNEK